MFTEPQTEQAPPTQPHASHAPEPPHRFLPLDTPFSSSSSQPALASQAPISPVSLEMLELEIKELEVLEKLNKHRTDNPIYFFNHPNPPQKKLLEAWLDPRYKVFTFTGSNRCGKTTLDIIISICVMLGEFPWNHTPLPFAPNIPRRVRYVGQDWEKHIQQVVMPTLEKWFPKDRPVNTRKNHVGVNAYWQDVKTGSTLEIMSNNQESKLHEGWAGDLVVYDEPPRRDIRIANARGLVDRRGRELFCMTLLGERWVSAEVIKAKLPDGKPDPTIFNVHATIEDNIGYGITTEGVEQFAKTLTDDEKQARLFGIPSYMSGLIYPMFSFTTHVKERFRVPLDWVVDIAIDVHPREKQAVLFIATAPDGRKYLCDEIWENGDGTAIAEEIIRYIKRNAYRVNDVIIDPLSKGDKNNENTVFDKIQDVLFRYGYGLKVASKDKTAGILQIKSFLKTPNGEAALFVFNDLRRTIFEFEGYMWDEDTQKPQDKDDHMMENLYRLMLLETKWSPIEDVESDDREIDSRRNAITGY